MRGYWPPKSGENINAEHIELTAEQGETLNNLTPLGDHHNETQMQVIDRSWPSPHERKPSTRSCSVTTCRR
jgi:hypothetical protein